jgi:hypothetical protein
LASGRVPKYVRVCPALQALSAQAEDLAIEDTILGLDKALQTGAAGLGVEAYLKQVGQEGVEKLLVMRASDLGWVRRMIGRTGRDRVARGSCRRTMSCEVSHSVTRQYH